VTTTVAQLKEIAKQSMLFSPWNHDYSHESDVATQPGWKPYRNVDLDTLKLYTKAHGAKTSNLIINLDHDDWILTDDSKTLVELGFENETEVSFFNGRDYEAFKLDPQTSWDA